MRLATYEPEQVIETGLVLQVEGRNTTGFALYDQVGGGNPIRPRQIWDKYQVSQSMVVTESVTGLLAEVAREVKAVSATLFERIIQLATELNDKAVRVAGQRAAEVARAAGEQTAQAERELVDAAQTVGDLEEKLDGLQDGHNRLTLALESERTLCQQQDVEMTQLKERLTATRGNARQREERYQEQKTVPQDALNAERAQHKNTWRGLQKRLEQIFAETDAYTEELKLERSKVSTLLTHLGSQENALVSGRQWYQITRETPQQHFRRAIVDAQAHTGKLTLERDRVSSLTARPESQEKASLE